MLRPASLWLRAALVLANLLVPIGGAIYEARAQVSSLIGPNASIADILQYTTPTNGQTIVVSPTASLVVLDNASLLATLTVTLPSTPMDGQRVILTSGAGITLLTINGGTIKGLITSLAVNGYARFAYSASANAWFRTG